MSPSDFADQIEADSLSRLEAVSEMQRQLAGLTGGASSPDGLIRVRVTPSGALLDLQLEERAMALRADELTATILQLSSRATAEVAEQVRAIVGSVVPPDDLEAMLAGSVPESVQAEVDSELARRRADLGPSTLGGAS